MSEKEIVQKQFGKNAGNYVTSKTHAQGPDLTKLIEVVKGHGKKDSLLDVATGGGHVANALAPVFKSVTALDLTADMIQEAQKFILSNGHDNVSFVQGDAENLPFPDELFEVVTCRIAAHHFPDVCRFISEVFRVLKTGGLFVLIDNVAPERNEYDEFFNSVEKKRDQSHFRAYKKSEWITMTENVGFQLESIHTFRKKFHFETWCSMMELPMKDKEELSTYIKAAAEPIIQQFSITFTNQDVESFEGQSILMAAMKK